MFALIKWSRLQRELVKLFKNPRLFLSNLLLHEISWSVCQKANI
jgi:hypothetical protein